jgi:polyhydroxybutyrate depolymerase
MIRADLSPADDIAFVRALILNLDSSLPIDPKAIYATGISNGGFFSNRLACDLSDKIAAIASVAATMPETLLPVCNPSRPISVMYVHGKNDRIVHIEGGAVMRNRGSALSLAQAAKFWREWDHTASNPQITELPDQVHDGTSIRRETYAGGAQGTEVVVYVIDGGGHTWPGASQYLPVFMVGKASQNMDATKVIWEFFQKHRRP